jgi:high-affinity nickel permease
MTTLLGPLLLGFLLGVKHALEADHVAAVAALATRSSSAAERVKLAGMWGLGHAGTLAVVGAGVLLLGLSLPPVLARVFEGAVGFMLILLGVDVLRRLRRQRVHFHTHRHADGTVHVHAHAHEGSVTHAHTHPVRTLPRALLVGSVHGLGGSAALLVLSVGMARSATQAFAYLALFGLGSIVGMCALSLAISLPLRHLPHRLGAASRGLEGALGTLTIALGSWIAVAVLLGP